MKVLRTCIGLLGCTAAVGLAIAGVGAAPTADDFERAMRSGDAYTEVSRLVRCDEEGQGTTVCERIASADRAWLQMGLRLLDYTDASAHGDICHSMALAMRRSPDDVLALLNKTSKATEHCLCLPFVSDELPPAERLAEYERSHPAIAGSRLPANAAARNACLGYIEPGRDKLRSLSLSRSAP